MRQAAFNEPGALSVSLRTAVNCPATGEPAYALYLRENEIDYSLATPYLISGVPADFDGWLVHISIVRLQFDVCIKPILEFLKSENLSFAIPADAEQHNNILGGACGIYFTAKVISIGIRSTDNVSALIHSLFNLTKDIIGPVMPSAFHLTDVIAVSHALLVENIHSDDVNKAIFYGSAIAGTLLSTIKSKDLSWPFKEFSPLNLYKESRLLNRQYIPMDMLKKDPKGNVIKALRINGFFKIQWCVLKQGRQYQSFDNYGRDATDRVRWQYHVHQRFERKGILPAAIGYFELNGDAFFAMDYKESVSLLEKSAQLSEGHAWRSIAPKRKRILLSYLLQIVKILGIFHEEEILHRDVTASNFIITDKDETLAIDIELCYDLRNSVPAPPFTLGTPGYMSPAQAAGLDPSIGDDIYSLGALMISVLTGILPNRLNKSDAELLATNLAWFIESSSMTAMIVSCFDENPALRPSLNEVRHVLELCDSVMITVTGQNENLPPITCSSQLQNILSDGFKTLLSILTKPGYTVIMTVLAGEGNISGVGDTFLSAYIDEWLENAEVIELPNYELHIMGGELSKLKDNTIRMLSFMSKAVPRANHPVDDTALPISKGLAGQGLKLLYLMETPSFPPDLHELVNIINQILAFQQADGSWAANPISVKGKEQRVTGFSHGVAGITYFLLCYYARYGSDRLKTNINLAMGWLIKQRKSDHERLTWTVSVENKNIDPWLEHGFSGVALTFIKAYEVLGDSGYKEIASQVLAYHPMYITSNNCSFGNGLAGLGEVYLEAFRVFGDQTWYDRASAVQGILLNSCYRDNGKCYWLDGTQLNPAADFWSGNAGILHFLLRFTRPNEIHFPTHLIS